MAPNARSTSKTSTLTALGGATLLAAMGISIVTVALPTLARAFSSSVSAVQWVVLAYLLSVTVTIVLTGKLGDRYGHRRLLMIGLVTFTLASIACALAPTLDMLIAGRALQGIGGAVLMAMPLSIAREVLDKEKIGAAMGLFGTLSAIGTTLGPSLGGVLISRFGWRAAFIVLALISAAVWLLATRVLPAPGTNRTKSTVSAAPLDWLGALLLAATLLLYALSTVAGKIALPIHAGLLLIVAAMALSLFVLVETQAASPLVPIAQLRDRVTGVSLLMNLLVSTVMMATLVVGPFFLSFSLGLNETLTGLVMAVGPLTAAFSGVPAGRLTDKFGPQRTRLFGLLQSTLGLVALACAPRFIGVAGYVAALMLLTPGFQLFLAANNTAVMLGAAAEQRGVLSGLLGLSRNLGFMTGASVMAALFATVLEQPDVAHSSPDAIARAFTFTFLAAASLSAIATVLTMFKRRRHSATTAKAKS